jgi:hypothetical protein
MRIVIYRIYHTPEGIKRFLQGKVFIPEGYEHHIYYRDVYPKRSTLWKTRYEKPESESYNIDHLVLDWLIKKDIKEIHYFIVPKRQLLRITIDKVERHIKLGNIKKETLNNHTQFFIPKDLFTKSKRDYKVPWINSEISINDLLKENEKEVFSGQLIPDEVKMKILKTIKSSNVQLASQLSLI